MTTRTPKEYELFKKVQTKIASIELDKIEADAWKRWKNMKIEEHAQAQALTQNSVYSSLLSSLFISIIQLPYASVCLFKDNVTTRENAYFILTSMHYIIIKIFQLINFPRTVGEVTERGIKWTKGLLILIVITLMLYHTPATQPYMILFFQYLHYFTGTYGVFVIEDWEKFAMDKTMQFFSLKGLSAAAQFGLESSKKVLETAPQYAAKVSTMAVQQVSESVPQIADQFATAAVQQVSESVPQIANEITNSLEMIVAGPQLKPAVTKLFQDVLSDENTQQMILNTLMTGPALGVVGYNLVEEVTGKLKLIYDESIVENFQKIQDMIAGIGEDVDAIKQNQETIMTQMYKNDLELVKKSIVAIENGQEMTTLQLKQLTQLVLRLEDTSVIGKVLKTTGITVTPDSIMNILNTAKLGIEIALGRNPRNQFLLQNEGGRRTRRNRKTQKKQKTRKKQRVRKSNKHKKRSKFKLKSKKK
jgi:hypothetical protein